MSAATDNRKYSGEGAGLSFAEIGQEWNGPIAANVVLHDGTLAGVLTSDTTTPNPGLKSFVADGTMAIRGFVTKGADNTGGAKGARPVRVRAQVGSLVDLNAGAGSAIAMPADYLKPIYAVDNQTCSKLVGDSAGGICIGVLVAIDPETGHPMVLVSPVVAKLMTAMASAGITFTQTYSTADATIAALTAAALVDNGGGTADGTVASQAAPTTITDSTGLSGSHDDTLAATTVPADLTGGEDPTEAEHNALLAVVRVMAQNISDLGQKVIELVTLGTTSQNNLKEVTTQLEATRADILAMKKNDNKIVDVLQAIGAAG